EAQDEDAWGRIAHHAPISSPARIHHGVSVRTEQFASGTRKVSTSACCPRMQAWLTPSVSTIQAENGSKEMVCEGDSWNEGVSFIQLWKRRIRRSYGAESRTRSIGKARLA